MSQIGGVDWLTRLNRLEASQNAANDTNAAPGNAISVTQGVFIITAGKATAFTLAAPIAGPQANGGQDGQILRITSATAFAHTVTTPANALNGAKHIATFAGAVGNGIELHAYNGQWIVFMNNGITLS